MTVETQENINDSSVLRKKEKARACHKKYRENNKTKVKARDKVYRERNKEKLEIQRKGYRERNKEKIKARDKAYYEANKEQLYSLQKAYVKKHKDEINEYKKNYEKARRQKNPLHNFFCNIRTAGNRVVKQVGLGKKPTNTFKWVGCSPEQLKAHIESLFLEGMTWDNYGKRGWHVDHIRPISSFKPEEWEQINHYTNLQPLWWQDNLSKGDR